MWANHGVDLICQQTGQAVGDDLFFLEFIYLYKI